MRIFLFFISLCTVKHAAFMNESIDMNVFLMLWLGSAQLIYSKIHRVKLLN